MPVTKQHMLPALASLALGLASHTATAAGPYALTDLGTLGGPVSTSYGLNNAGTVVGSSDTASGTSHASAWRGAAPRRATSVPWAAVTVLLTTSTMPA